MAFGHHLKIPVIGLSSAALYPWGHATIGNPKNLAFVPNNLLDYVPPMTFWQRLYNTVHDMYADLSFRYYSSPQDEIIKKYFGEDTPGVRELERSVALVLANSHPALSGPRPVTPALIEVGGLHVQDDGTELPRVNCPYLFSPSVSSACDLFISFLFRVCVCVCISACSLFSGFKDLFYAARLYDIGSPNLCV